MASYNNDLLIFPILDLIRREINNSNLNTGGVADSEAPPDYSNEYPSVTLNRDDPTNPTQVTSVSLTYTTYTLIVSLNRDSDTGELLNVVLIASDNQSGNTMYDVTMTLNYDSVTGLLDSVDTTYNQEGVSNPNQPYDIPLDPIQFNS